MVQAPPQTDFTNYSLRATPFPMSDSEDRLTTVEVKMAYLEKLCSELNEVVIIQARLIEELANRLRRVEGQLEGFSPGSEFPHERPPHY